MTAPRSASKLSSKLCFARKPHTLDDLSSYLDTPRTVYVVEKREMSAAEFDAFASDLLESRDWLAGKGGTLNGAALCIEISAPNRPRLYVNPEGSDYARYVALVAVAAEV